MLIRGCGLISAMRRGVAYHVSQGAEFLQVAEQTHSLADDGSLHGYDLILHTNLVRDRYYFVDKKSQERRARRRRR